MYATSPPATSRATMTIADRTRLLLHSQGSGCVLGLGRDPAELRALLAEGVEGWGLSADPTTVRVGQTISPGRWLRGHATALPFPDLYFESVIISEDVEDSTTTAWPARLQEARRVCRGGLLIRVRLSAEGETATRTGWETLALAAGWRHHPLYRHLQPFVDDADDTPDQEIVLLLQRCPKPEDIPPDEDILRQSGRRAAVLATLYHRAADCIDAGQHVLDVGAATGWGGAILARRSTAARIVVAAASADAGDYARRHYACADGRLAVLDYNAPEMIQDRFDIIILRQHADIGPEGAGGIWNIWASRLRPGGRLLILAPLQPGGAATWQALRAGFSDTLALDRQFALKEGASPQEPDAPRECLETDPAQEGSPRADWALLVAVTSPFVDVSIKERSARMAGVHHDVRAWWRDYDTPWLVETLVNLGARVRNPRLLRAWAERAAATARAGSPDQGAALCILAYRLLEDHTTPWAELAAHLDRIAAYQAGADTTPHALRWRVSLHYVAGLLWLQGGFRRQAHDAFVACGRCDVATFSASLGTKTVAAWLRAGRLALDLDGVAAARRHWLQALVTTRHLFQGDWQQVWGDITAPYWVEIREAADVIDRAMDAATALASLPHHAAQPGLLHEKTVWGRAGFPGRIQELERAQMALRSEIITLQERLRAAERQHEQDCATLNDVIGRQQGDIGGLHLKEIVLRATARLLMGQEAEAATLFATAEAADPLWGVWFAMQALLGHGRLHEGWSLYARRFALGLVPDRATNWPWPCWQGEALTADETLLVWREQGLGDELLFASCYPDLLTGTGSGPVVVLECDPRLQALLARSFPAARVLPAPASPDCVATVGTPSARIRQTPAGALPRWLRPTLDTFPAAANWNGYLVADPQRVAAARLWRTQLGPGRVLGLCWRGRRSAASAADYDGLSTWAPLLALPGMHFVSLQYDPDPAAQAAAAATFGVTLHHWPGLDLTHDLDGVAALMTVLDQIITAPTMVGDLAGALGRPVWRIDPADDGWRLGTAGRPWYPCMTILPDVAAAVTALVGLP